MATAAWTPPGTSDNPHILPKPPLSFADIVSGKADPASPRTASKSFSSIFENGGTLPIKSPGMFKGEPALFFSKEEIEKLSSPFRYTLIGKFSYWRPSMDVIRKFFNSLGLKSLKSVGLIHDNHVVIFISNQEDYSRLMFKPTWYVNGAPLKISNWTPDFLPFYDSPVVPVWIGFPGLPLHFFEKSVLFSLASMFGSPLKTDEPTALLTRPSVARVCVDLDVSKPRRNRLWLGDEKVGFWQEVVFENPPLFCSFCQKLGHDVDICFVKNPELKKEKNPPTKILEKQKNQFLNKNEDVDTLTWKKKPTPSTEVINYVEAKSSKGVKDVITREDEGVWLIQKSKRNKKNKNTVDKIQIPVPKDNPSLGVALTPLNPLFLAKLSKTKGLQKIQHCVPTLESSQMNSQFREKTSCCFPAHALEKEIDTTVVLSQSQPLACKNGGSSSVVPAQIIQPSISEITEKQKLLVPSTLPETSNPLSTFQNRQSTSDKNLSTATSSSTSMQISKNGLVNSNFKQSQPLVSLVKNVQPLICLPNQSSQKGGPLVHLCETRDKKMSQEHVSLDFENATAVSLSQPHLSLESGLKGCTQEENVYIQGIQIQPSLSSGPHEINDERGTNIGLQFQPSSLSLPHASGPHALDNHPSIDQILQPLPLNSLEVENGNTIQPITLPLTHNGGDHFFNCKRKNVSNENGLAICGLNSVPSILKEFGPDSPQDFSQSSGPVLVDDLLGPNSVIVVNPNGQSYNKNADFNRSQGFLAQGSKVHLPFNIIHIHSLLLSFLADHGVVVRPPLHKALVQFSNILENSFDDSWEVSWPFFQENLFRFIKSSDVTIPKKTRRVLKFFFQVAEEKNWPFSNTKGKMPVVEDSSSYTDGST